MIRKIRWLLMMACLLAGVLSFAQNSNTIGGGDATSTRVTMAGAVVTETSGLVTVQTEDGKVEPLNPGQPLRPGMIINTGAGATAVAVYPDGQICVLGERSMFRTIAYNYDTRDPTRHDVYLNLIVGSMRIVMGEIGQTNPSAVRVQIGMATMGVVPTPQGTAADASVVVQGGPVAVSVQSGRVDVRLPTGVSQEVASGRALYFGLDGSLQVGTTGQILQQLAQISQGQEVREQLAVLDSFSPKITQTVITLATVTSAIKDPEAASAGKVADEMAQAILKQLASLPSTEEIPPQQPRSPALVSGGTPSTGGGGGGLSCGASCS